MSSVLDLGKQYGNIVMDGLILPILNDVYEGKSRFFLFLFFALKKYKSN